MKITSEISDTTDSSESVVEEEWSDSIENLPLELSSEETKIYKM